MNFGNIATYVKNNYETSCPKCGNKHRFGFHLNPDQLGTPFDVNLKTNEVVLNKYIIIRGRPTITCLLCGQRIPRKKL